MSIFGEKNNMMKKSWTVLFLALLLGIAGCTKPPVTPEESGSGSESGTTAPDSGLDEQTKNIYRYARTFAVGRMNLYYLWQAEIEKDLKAWKETEEPIEKVYGIRYKNAQGKDVDRWSMLTDNFSGFYNSVSGTEETAGFDFTFYFLDSSHTSLCAVVNFVYPDSPAEKAGLKRGDVIEKVNGAAIPYPSYTNAYYTLMGGEKFTVSLYDSKQTLTIDPVEMYLDPVLLTKLFDCGSKKVGYLHYTSFTLDSCEELISACKAFKEEGISELIVDLRYNGGGFAITEQVIASMLAPEKVVANQEVLSTEVFNSKLTQYYKQNNYDTNTYFSTDYDLSTGGKSYVFTTSGANLNLDKLYFIISSGTASASEALIGDLVPYMPVVLLGGQTHGKYCSGLMLSAEDYWEENANQLGGSFTANAKKYTDNWGLYLMYSRFADKNGETLCMPDGIVPDQEVDDDPLDGYQLGDPEETMLKETLKLCGYKQKAPAALRGIRRDFQPEKAPIAPDELRPDYGLRIVLPERAGLH